jgi:hypothetical protein
VPVYPVIGNRDSYVKNIFDPNGGEAYEELADIWADWLGDEKAIQDFKNG